MHKELNWAIINQFTQEEDFYCRESMNTLTKLLRNKALYKKKIRELPRNKVKAYISIIKILVLSDHQIIDATIATYFEDQIRVSPITTPHRIPIGLLPKFSDDKEFFCYISDLLKERVMVNP